MLLRQMGRELDFPFRHTLAERLSAVEREPLAGLAKWGEVLVTRE